MSHRGFPWWFLAISLSLLLHLLLFLEWGDRQMIAAAPIDLARITHVRLTFHQPLPQPEPELEPEPEPEPVVEPVVEPEPEPVIEPQPKPEMKTKPEPMPEPRPKPKPKPKPNPKPKPKPKPKIAPQPVATTPAVAKAEPQKQHAAPVPAPQPTDTVGRERYLATLLSLIEQQKVYPRVARRRDIQGSVHVAFSVTCNGSIIGLQTDSGHKILQKAARKAVQKALPLPPAENPCPVRVEYAMVFKLH